MKYVSIGEKIKSYQKDRLLDEAEEHVRQRIVQMEATISSLAHEIGNPLGSILMIVQHLQRKIGDQEHMGVHLGRIRDDITRIDRLLKDALQSTRSTEPRVFPQDITKLLDGLLVGREQLLVDNRIIVYKQYHPDLPLALIDREKIQQVFDNLIINAIHAMPDGGHLAISVNKARIPNGTLNGDRQVLEIKVGDTGIGISQEIQERMTVLQGQLILVDTQLEAIEGFDIVVQPWKEENLRKAIIDIKTAREDARGDLESELQGKLHNGTIRDLKRFVGK